MREYTYYPGCSAEASSRPYDVSARSVAEAVGARLIELEDWNCCGATTYMSVEEKRAMALSARNLALAEKENRDLVTICNGCYCVLSKTHECMTGNGGLRKQLANALQAADLEYHGTVRVRHLLDVLVNDIGEEAIRSKVTSELKGLRVAPYYGCQLSRPKGRFGDPEFPTALDDLLSWLGADPVWYPLKAKCCGGMLMTVQADVCEKLVHRLLSAAVDAGAECLATLCPLCQINLEAYQEQISRKYGRRYDLPIFYFTQIVGLALGMGNEELRLSDNLTQSEAIVARY
jgi:heterodisulfide reductase subunit B